MAAKNAVTTTAATGVAQFDYGDDAGAGMDLSKDNFLVPMLSILQSKSPEVEADNAPAIAKAGNLVCRATQEFFDGRKGLPVVLIGSDHSFVVWNPRSKGGGILETHAPGSDFVRGVFEKNRGRKFGKLKIDGSEWTEKSDVPDLVETFYDWGVRLDPETMEPVGGLVIPMSSSNINPHKAVMTKLRTIMLPKADGGRINPPIFAHLLNFGTERKSKNGNTWEQFAIGYASVNDGSKTLTAADARLDPRGPIYQAARDMFSVYKSGDLKMDTTGAASDDVGGEGGGVDRAPRADASRDDSEVPF